MNLALASNFPSRSPGERIAIQMGMPRLDGYEAAPRMRSRPWAEKLTLVAVTGRGQEADKRKTLEVGFDHHLTKPIDSRTLKSVLRRGTDSDRAQP